MLCTPWLAAVELSFSVIPIVSWQSLSRAITYFQCFLSTIL
ncbi:hypothetical protein [Piscirickettsia salmonis]